MSFGKFHFHLTIPQLQVDATFSEKETDTLLLMLSCAVSDCERWRELADTAAGSEDDAMHEAGMRLAKAADERHDTFMELQVRIIQLLVEGKDVVKPEPETASLEAKPEPIVKHILAKRIRPGMRVQTTTGMRTVLRVETLDVSSVAVTVVDPAVASGKGELKFVNHESVLVSYDPSKVTES